MMQKRKRAKLETEIRKALEEDEVALDC